MARAAPIILIKSVFIRPAIFILTIVLVLRRIGIRSELRRRRRRRVASIGLRRARLLRLLIRKEEARCL